MFSLNALVIDFETRSACDLKLEGGDNYALHGSTDILCLCAINLQTGQEWTWWPEIPIPVQLVKALNEAEYIIAHNARFDQQIYENIAAPDYLFPEIPAERWYCSAAQCRVNALPGKLDDAARAISHGKHRKDHRGSALIRKLSIPQEDGKFNNDPDLHKAMREYCLQDVRITVEVVKNTRLLTQVEHQDWLVNERINNTGIMLDAELAQLAKKYAGVETEEIAEQLTALTNGMVTKHTQHQRIRDFVLSHLRDGFTEDEPHPAEKMMIVYKKGEKKYSMDKSVRANILNYAAAEATSVPQAVVDIVELSDAGNKSSVAKFGSMLARADDEDGRIRGAFMYAGAGQTKRYSSKGAQVHNFRRDCFSAEDAEHIIFDMIDGYELDEVMNTLSKMLRPSLVPAEGKVFVVGDWSSIEGRFLPWLTDDARAESTFRVFRENDADETKPDLYEFTAASMGIDERQIGKVAALSLGYQGAVGAFSSMAKNYGLYLPEARIKSIVKKWRSANPWAVDFWAKLERTAMLAVRNPGKKFEVGKLEYIYSTELLEGTLFAILPNGEAIQYPMARLEDIQTDYGAKRAVTYLKASLNPAADQDEWPRAALYGGLMAENVTQAISAALLREKLRDLDVLIGNMEIADVVMHVHDEIVIEATEKDARHMAGWLQATMEKVPDWAEGLPLKAEPEIMTRYGK